MNTIEVKWCSCGHSHMYHRAPDGDGIRSGYCMQSEKGDDGVTVVCPCKRFKQSSTEVLGPSDVRTYNRAKR